MTSRLHKPAFKGNLVLCAIALSGCAVLDNWHTEYAPQGFVPETRVLAEVVVKAPREAVVSGKGYFRDWHNKLIAAGYSDTDVVDGSEVSTWAYCYGHNGGVPQCANHGHYLAHVPPELRKELRSIDESDSRGDLVEVELTATPDGQLVGKVVIVFRTHDNWADCRIVHLKPPGAGLFQFMYGPPHGTWLECDDLEADGWIRRPVLGAPPVGRSAVVGLAEDPGRTVGVVSTRQVASGNIHKDG